MNCLIKFISARPFQKVVYKRGLWQWLNIMFNSVDEQRRKQYGPNRVCAEWLLRNGGTVKWTNSTEFITDYNLLPPEDTELHIKEVDATESSISHYGFEHFVGCNSIDKLILHKCSYLENEGLRLLTPLNKSLTYLEVSSCGNITEPGLNSLKSLTNLNTLVLFDFPYVKDKEGVLKNLSKELVKCNITFK